MSWGMSRFAGLRDFLMIWAGQLVSAIGSRLSSFALGIWVLRSTGSTTQFALIYIAMDIPLLFVSPFAGALVDRWDRRRLMIACDSICAITSLVLAGLLATEHLAIWQVYIGVGLMSLCTAFHSPAFSASIPLLASAEQLPRVNGMVQTGNAAASIIGPLVAGALVSLISLHGVLAVDALTFLVAVGALLAAGIPGPPRTAHQMEASLLGEAAIGWRYVHERKGLLGLLLLDGFKGFVFAIASVLITPLLLTFADPAQVGLQYAVSGCGLLLGGLAVTTFGAPERRARGILWMTFICGIFLAMHGLRPSYLLVVGAGLVMFVTFPMGAVMNASLWQRKVPADLQGRCFAIQQVLANGATPLGFALAGILSEQVFEPLLIKDGVLAASIGQWIGVGPGRGIGLMFILLGVMLMVAAAIAASVSAIRRTDDLPDAVEDGPQEEKAATAATDYVDAMAR